MKLRFCFVRSELDDSLSISFVCKVWFKIWASVCTLVSSKTFIIPFPNKERQFDHLCFISSMGERDLNLKILLFVLMYCSHELIA